MSLSFALGSSQLLPAGASLSDVALCLDFDRKFGNWLRVASNDKELLDSIGEDPEAILKRRGLIDVTCMESKWSQNQFMYQGHHQRTSSNPKESAHAGGRAFEGPKPASKKSHKESVKQPRDKIGPTASVALTLSSFSWLMTTVVTALDLCLPSSDIKGLLMRVYRRVLDGDQQLEESLRILLPTSIESWRSTGCVKNMTIVVSRAMKKCREAHVANTALPQLNVAEKSEMEDFLFWLLAGEHGIFKAVSVMVFAVAKGLQKAGVSIRTDGERVYESEPLVSYEKKDELLGPFTDLGTGGDPSHFKRGIGNRAQQIAYPRESPSTMIHAISVGSSGRRRVLEMTQFWNLGEQAASKMILNAEAQLPYSAESEIYYTLENQDREVSGFHKETIMLSGRGFPEQSESLLLAVEKLTEGVNGANLQWLQQHTELEYLKRTEDEVPSQAPEHMDLWLKYQSLVFGFYYKLVEPKISLELVNKDAYFRGIWGFGSTTFLAMCIEFGETLRRTGSVSRTHLLFMLATMYNGRLKTFPVSSPRKGLLGVLGCISVLARPLLRTTDRPDEISSFMLTDLPIVDLMSDTDGELYCGRGGIDSVASPAKVLTTVGAKRPSEEWSVHPKMGLLFGDGLPGVVVAARCAGRLVGWFSPLAADVAFLSTAYQKSRHVDEADYRDNFTFVGFEVDDSQWQNGVLSRPPETGGTGSPIGIIQSRGCPALRYAAAGFYSEAREEVAIATDDLEAAYGRVDGQGEGFVVA